jgi:site-specific recombinase XerD
MVLPVNEISTRVIDGRIITPQMELAARLTAEWRDELSGATRDAYMRDLALWQTWASANGVDVLAARTTHVGRWITSMQEAGLAKRTVARRVSAISAWYRYLNEQSDGTPTPVALVNPARTKKRPKVARDDSPTLGLTKTQARLLVAAADEDGLRSAALIRLLLGNGLRVGSVVGARIENMAEDEGHRVIMLGGKGDVRRKVAIPPPAYSAIKKMLAERGNPETGPLFATRTGRPVDRHYVFRLIRRLAERAKIPTAAKLSPHSARKTFASAAISRGVSLHQLQGDMWHADPRTTEGYILAWGGLDKSTCYVVAGGFEPEAEDE